MKRSSFRISLYKSLLVSLAALCLSSCILAPAIQSISELGVSGGDRQRLLAAQVKKFNDALYWGNPGEALAFANDEQRPALAQELQTRSRDERIVESKVEGVNFAESNYSADVDVVVKYFRVPYYMVNERRERQKWEFSMVDGWKLAERSILENKS